MKFFGKKIMVVTAHPDDEAYLASGTIFANQKSGGETILVCATLGEKGKSHLSKKVIQTQLKETRKKELQSVCKLLKVKSLLLLNLKDGNLCNSENILIKKLKKLVKEYQPEILISFGPDGITGHLDHVAVGKSVKHVTEEVELPLVVFAPPPCFMKQTNAVKARRKHGIYKDKIIYSKPNLKIKIDPKLKLKTILIHKSQISEQDPFKDLPKGSKKEILNHEYFKV